MIVCQCMGVSDHEIRAAVGWMRASDADTIITPGKIYRAWESARIAAGA